MSSNPLHGISRAHAMPSPPARQSAAQPGQPNGVVRQPPAPPPAPLATSPTALTTLQSDVTRKAFVPAQHFTTAYTQNRNAHNIPRRPSVLDASALSGRMHQLAQMQLEHTTGSLPLPHSHARRASLMLSTSAVARVPPPPHGGGGSNGTVRRLERAYDNTLAARRASHAVTTRRPAPSATNGSMNAVAAAASAAAAARAQSAGIARARPDERAPLEQDMHRNDSAAAGTAAPSLTVLTDAGAQTTRGRDADSKDNAATRGADGKASERDTSTVAEVNDTNRAGGGETATDECGPPRFANGGGDGATATAQHNNGAMGAAWPARSTPRVTSHAGLHDAHAHRKPRLHSNNDTRTTVDTLATMTATTTPATRSACQNNGNNATTAAGATASANSTTPPTPPQRVLSAEAHGATNARAGASPQTSRRVSDAVDVACNGNRVDVNAAVTSIAMRPSRRRVSAVSDAHTPHDLPSDTDLSLLSMPSLSHEAGSSTRHAQAQLQHEAKQQQLQQQSSCYDYYRTYEQLQLQQQQEQRNGAGAIAASVVGDVPRMSNSHVPTPPATTSSMATASTSSTVRRFAATQHHVNPLLSCSDATTQPSTTVAATPAAPAVDAAAITTASPTSPCANAASELSLLHLPAQHQQMQQQRSLQLSSLTAVEVLSRDARHKGSAGVARASSRDATPATAAARRVHAEHGVGDVNDVAVDAAMDADACTAVTVTAAGTDGSCDDKVNGDGGAREQEWLQVPGLFYLFANLVELHESLLQRRHAQQQAQHQRQLQTASPPDNVVTYSGYYDDDGDVDGNDRATRQQQQLQLQQMTQSQPSFLSLAPPSLRASPQSLLHVHDADDEALTQLRNRISYAVYEVRSIFLNHLLVTWSDRRLRSLVQQVVDAWTLHGGGDGDAMDVASYDLLDAISRDERGRIRYRTLYRVWHYLGDAHHRHVTLTVSCASACVALASVVALAVLGGVGVSTLAATVVLAVLGGVGVLSWFALTAALVHHNAYADLTAHFFRSEALSTTTDNINRDDDDDDDNDNSSVYAVGDDAAMATSFMLDGGSGAVASPPSPSPLLVTSTHDARATSPSLPLPPPPSQLTTRSVDAMRRRSSDRYDTAHVVAARRSDSAQSSNDRVDMAAAADDAMTTTTTTTTGTRMPADTRTAVTATTTATTTTATTTTSTTSPQPRYAIPSPPPTFLVTDGVSAAAASAHVDERGSPAASTTTTTTAAAAATTPGNVSNTLSPPSLALVVQPATRPAQQQQQQQRQLEQDRENALLMSGINYSQHQHHVQQHQERVLRSSIILSSALPSAYGAAALFANTATPSSLSANTATAAAIAALPVPSSVIAAANKNNNNNHHSYSTLTSTTPTATTTTATTTTTPSPLTADVTPSSIHGTMSTPSPPLSLPLDTSVRNMIRELRDSINVTALLYCADDAVAASVALALWQHNFLVVRARLDVLDAAYHRGSERFKVFLLHAPDLPEASPALRTALAWVGEKRPVYFFSSDVGAYAVQLPVASCLELPLSDGDVSALLLAGLGIDELNCSVLAPSPMPFRVPAYMLGRRLGGGAYGNVFEVVMEKTGARCAVKRIYLRGRDEERVTTASSAGRGAAAAAVVDTDDDDGGGGGGADSPAPALSMCNHHNDDGGDGDGDDDDDDDAGPQSQLREIAQEVEIMSSLSHPNIVQYMFCERDDNCISIFMELCSGGSLGTLIKSRSLVDADQVRRILTDIISAVAYLHNKRIVHRDLKPDNVLFRDGRAKVTDFGTAVHKRGDLRHIKGTFAYMAPEILLGESYGKACDVWSIGCIAAEVLAVQLPQHALGLPEMAEYYRSLGLDAALDIDCSVPAVRDFLLACLQRNPHARQTAARLLEHEILQPGNMPLRRWMDVVAERLQSQRRPGGGVIIGGSSGGGGGGGGGVNGSGAGLGGFVSRHMYNSDFGSDDTVSLKSSQVVGYDDH